MNEIEQPDPFAAPAEAAPFRAEATGFRVGSGVSPLETRVANLESEIALLRKDHLTLEEARALQGFPVEERRAPQIGVGEGAKPDIAERCVMDLTGTRAKDLPRVRAAIDEAVGFHQEQHAGENSERSAKVEALTKENADLRAQLVAAKAKIKADAPNVVEPEFSDPVDEAPFEKPAPKGAAAAAKRHR
jgi:hypothetical protein